MSLTGGFIGLILGWFFGFGFYAIALALFVRSIIHAFIYSARCQIEIESNVFTGPKVMLQETVSVDREGIEKVEVVGGRFFIKDGQGREISARFGWYDEEGQKVLRRLIEKLKSSF